MNNDTHDNHDDDNHDNDDDDNDNDNDNESNANSKLWDYFNMLDCLLVSDKIFKNLSLRLSISVPQ